MICPQCGRSMTGTTPEKSYCMKCDILIHTPSGIAYTGNPEKDKFIGVPGVLLNDPRLDFAATLGPAALLLTWKDGSTFRMEKVPCLAITGLDTGERKQSEVASLGSAAGAALGAGLAFGVLSLVEQALTSVKTLKVKTEAKEYEMWVPEATKWADRLKAQQTGQVRTFVEPTAKPQPSVDCRQVADVVKPTKFCRECGAKIPRDSTYCEKCGTRLA